ncbi:hypothetical protein GCM10023237_21950 [Streptomyces coeruleoprunus]
MTSRQQHSFPRQYARTQRFTLGVPRSFTVAPDGSRVVFLRSPSGERRDNHLCVLDMDGEVRERVAADPGALLGGADEELPPEERARRERTREGAEGIVAYAVDDAVELAAFALSGRLFVAELRAGTARQLTVRGPVIDPRPSPDGRHVAYVAKGALRVAPVEGGGDTDGFADRVLAGPEGEHVTYGLAEFVAAEEMGRSRGFWWSPDSTRLLVARVDDGAVQRWWLSDPAHPDREPAGVAYPAAGTANAEVRLFLVGLDGGERTEVVWDRVRFPYLARVHWSSAGRRCCSCSPVTSALSSTWRSTRRPGRPVRCMSTRTRPGWNWSPGCRRGHRTGGSCGSPTRAAPAYSRSATGRSRVGSCTSARCWTWARTTYWFRPRRVRRRPPGNWRNPCVPRQ